MMVRVLRSRAEFAEIRDAWTALWAESHRPSPCLHWHWLDCFWEELIPPGMHGAMVTAWDGDRLAGAAPVVVAPARLFEPAAIIGMENAHTPAYRWLLPADGAAAETAAGDIARTLASLTGKRTRVSWRNAPGDDADTLVARAALQSAGWRVIWRPQRPHRVIHFERGADALIASLSANMRARLRKSGRRLEQMGTLRFRNVSAESDLVDRLGRAWDLEARSWKGQGGTAVKQDKTVRRFYDSLAARLVTEDRFVLFELTSNDRLVSFFYGLREPDRIWGLKFSYDTEFSRASPGHVMIWRIIEWALARGVPTLDLGPDSDFKSHWGGELQPMGSIHALPRGISGAAAVTTLAGRAAVRGVRRRLFRRQTR